MFCATVPPSKNAFEEPDALWFLRMDIALIVPPVMTSRPFEAFPVPLPNWNHVSPAPFSITTVPPVISIELS